MAHDVEAFVRELNRAWVERRYDELHAFFDERAVMVSPADGTSGVGVDAMVDSYRQFGALATVHRFEVGEIELHPRAGVVIAHARFDIDYEIAGARFQEQGVEVYVVDVAGAAPKVVWRHQIALTDPGA